MQEVSVVIPNFNGMAYLDGVLSSLERQTIRNFEVILVDNGSTDGSCAFVSAEYPWVHMIQLPENYGFSRAVNEGIHAARSPYVLLLNNDTEAEPDFLEEMVAALRRHKKAFSCQAKMIQLHDHDKMDDAGNYYCALGWAFARGKDKDINHYDKEQKIFPPARELPFTEKKSSTGSEILMKSILPIWRIWISVIAPGSLGIRTGMLQRRKFIMWEAEQAVPDIISLRSGIHPEIIFTLFTRTCRSFRSF